jgi:hypothetical protein
LGQADQAGVSRHKTHICKSCGDRIIFMPRSLSRKGEPKYYPANPDGTSHYARCRINQDLARAQREASQQRVEERKAKVAAKAAAAAEPAQGEMFNATRTRTPRDPDR